MSVKKAYAKFKKGMDKSAFGIGATTTAKDYGLGDSMFNKGKMKKKKSGGKGGVPIKSDSGKNKAGNSGRIPINQKPTPPARRP